MQEAPSHPGPDLPTGDPDGALAPEAIASEPVLPVPPMPIPAPPHVVSEADQRRGIMLILLVSTIFALQDGLSRHLGSVIPPVVVVMLRYWFLAVFVTFLAARAPGGLRAAIRTKRPVLQIMRGLLIALEIVVVLEAFVRLGLVETHAVFSAYPLLAVLLSILLLGEKVGWRRSAAVIVGFIGVLIILRPGTGVFSPAALLALLSAFMFALYGVLTRLVSRDDPPMTSFFWMGITGFVAITLVGLSQWQPLPVKDWGWMALLCLTGAIAHGLMIRAYSLAEASALQPFTYTQLIWVVLVGMLVFGETVAPAVWLGGAIVVSAGLFTVLRTRKRQQEDAPEAG